MLVLGLASIILFSQLVSAASGCTKSGTAGSDTLQGTRRADWLCAKAGADYSNGRGAADTVSGGSGNDTLVGGAGPDDILGRRGRDELFGVDDNTGDFLSGGLGFDKCYGDVGDQFAGCEHIVRVS